MLIRFEKADIEQQILITLVLFVYIAANGSELVLKLESEYESEA